MSETVQRIFTATLVMGVSGSGKTSLLSTFAEYLWETHKKILLLYSWDGGAIPNKLQVRMKQGLVRFWRAHTRSAEGLAIETAYLSTKGYWPRTINPLTGETDPAVTMVPPVTVRYETYCGKGHLLQTVPSPTLIVATFCSVCKELPNANLIQVKEVIKRTKGFELVGGVAFDSLSSMAGGTILDEMDRQRGAGLIGGEKAAFGGVVMSGSMKFGGNNRADIGFAQTRGQQFVRNSLSIPNLVEGPVFTGLTLEATDEGGLSVVGLKLPGRAATDEASTWFGNVMETARLFDEQGQTHFSIYLKPFTDRSGRQHLLKTSASPGFMPAILQDPAEEENRPNSVANLGRVFRLLDEDLRKGLDEAAKGMPELPGVTDTYGEPVTIQPGPAQAVAPPVAAPSPAAPRMQPSKRQAAPAPMPPTPTDSPASTATPPPPPGTRSPQRAPGT